MAARLPNPTWSRIVLIGAGTVPAELDLPGLPGLRGLLTSLRGRLSGTVKQPTALYDPRSAARVCNAVRRAAAEATDLLLVYCAGHVRPDQDGRPRLLVAATVPGELAATAVSMDELTGYITHSRAPTKVLLLDCDGWTVRLPGVAVLASGRSRTPHRRPMAFTEALLAALDNPDPPSFEGLRRRINRELVCRDEPKAQASAAQVVLVRGLADSPPIEDQPAEAVPHHPVSDELRVGRDPAVARKSERNGLIGVVVFDALLGIGTAASALWLHGWASVLTGFLAIVLLVGVLAFFGYFTDPIRTGTTTLLQLDKDRITLHRLAADSVRIPWSDVLTAGLLPRSLCTDGSNANLNHAVFAVKLRSGVTLPVVNLLVAEADRLGYVGLAKLDHLDTTANTLLAQLDVFAEGKAAHSNRDWCARHPELRRLLD